MAGRRFTHTQARRAAARLGVDWSRVRYTVADLARGMNVEREHRRLTGGGPTASAAVALDHLRERPDYYDLLARVERAPRRRR